MKSLLVLLTMFVAFAASASQPCLPQAYDVVKELEEFWAKKNGPIQGDYAEPQISHNSKIIKEGLVTYSFEAQHTNEDQEAWYNEYTITMSKEWCSLDSYKFLGSTTTTKTCVDLDTAKKELNRVMDFYVNTVPVDLFFWLEEDNENHILTAPLMTEAEGDLKWDNYEEIYSTGILFSGYCAAGAECWGGFTVSCDGEFDTWWDGEE